jgi:hypothetical protein
MASRIGGGPGAGKGECDVGEVRCDASFLSAPAHGARGNWIPKHLFELAVHACPCYVLGRTTMLVCETARPAVPPRGGRCLSDAELSAPACPRAALRLSASSSRRLAGRRSACAARRCVCRTAAGRWALAFCWLGYGGVGDGRWLGGFGGIRVCSEGPLAGRPERTPFEGSLPGSVHR